MGKAIDRCFIGLLFFASSVPLFSATVIENGLIGRWTPGIGDPSIVGWVTVGFYLLAAFCCLGLAFTVRKGRERFIWGLFAFLFLFLGINKQLDLQTAFTELLRIIAKADGWYDIRRRYQRVFILGLGAAALFALAGLALLMRKLQLGVWVSAAGACLVVAYVLIRAASFHNVDILIHSRIFGIKWNWILEIGGLSVVLLGALLRSLKNKRQRS